MRKCGLFVLILWSNGHLCLTATSSLISVQLFTLEIIWEDTERPTACFFGGAPLRPHSKSVVLFLSLIVKKASTIIRNKKDAVPIVVLITETSGVIIVWATVYSWQKDFRLTWIPPGYRPTHESILRSFLFTLHSSFRDIRLKFLRMTWKWCLLTEKLCLACCWTFEQTTWFHNLAFLRVCFIIRTCMITDGPEIPYS